MKASFFPTTLLQKNRPDRISEILGSHADGGPEHTDCTGGLVVKLKCPGVNVDLLQLKVILQTGVIFAEPILGPSDM